MNDSDDVGSSPEEISRDVGEVVLQLNQVKRILEPACQTISGFDRANDYDGISDPSGDIGLDETANVVLEAKDSLVALKEILESGDELEAKEDKTLEAKKDKKIVMSDHFDDKASGSSSKQKFAVFTESNTLLSSNFKSNKEKPNSDLTAEELERSSLIFERNVENVTPSLTLPQLSELHGINRKKAEKGVCEITDLTLEIESAICKEEDVLSLEFERTIEGLSTVEDNSEIFSESTRTGSNLDDSFQAINKDSLEEFLAADLKKNTDSLANISEQNNQKKEINEEICFKKVFVKNDDHSPHQAANKIKNDQDLINFMKEDLERHQVNVESVSNDQEHMIEEETIVETVKALPEQQECEERDQDVESNSSQLRSFSGAPETSKCVRFYENVTVIDDQSISSLHSLDKAVTLQSSIENECSDLSSIESPETDSETTGSVSFSPPQSDSDQSELTEEEAPDPVSIRAVTLQDRIRAYKAATDELHREVERFRLLTSPQSSSESSNIRLDSEKLVKDEKLIPKHPSAFPSMGISALKKTDKSFELENQSRDAVAHLDGDKTSPVVVEESRSVGDLLEAWEAQTPTRTMSLQKKISQTELEPHKRVSNSSFSTVDCFETKQQPALRSETNNLEQNLFTTKSLPERQESEKALGSHVSIELNSSFEDHEISNHSSSSGEETITSLNDNQNQVENKKFHGVNTDSLNKKALSKEAKIAVDSCDAATQVTEEAADCSDLLKNKITEIDDDKLSHPGSHFSLDEEPLSEVTSCSELNEFERAEQKICSDKVANAQFYETKYQPHSQTTVPALPHAAAIALQKCVENQEMAETGHSFIDENNKTSLNFSNSGVSHVVIPDLIISKCSEESLELIAADTKTESLNVHPNEDNLDSGIKENTEKQLSESEPFKCSDSFATDVKNDDQASVQKRDKNVLNEFNEEATLKDVSESLDSNPAVDVDHSLIAECDSNSDVEKNSRHGALSDVIELGESSVANKNTSFDRSNDTFSQRDFTFKNVIVAETLSQSTSDGVVYPLNNTWLHVTSPLKLESPKSISMGSLSFSKHLESESCEHDNSNRDVTCDEIIAQPFSVCKKPKSESDQDDTLTEEHNQALISCDNMSNQEIMPNKKVQLFSNSNLSYLLDNTPQTPNVSPENTFLPSFEKSKENLLEKSLHEEIEATEKFESLNDSLPVTETFCEHQMDGEERTCAVANNEIARKKNSVVEISFDDPQSDCLKEENDGVAFDQTIESRVDIDKKDSSFESKKLQNHKLTDSELFEKSNTNKHKEAVEKHEETGEFGSNKQSVHASTDEISIAEECSSILKDSLVSSDKNIDQDPKDLKVSVSDIDQITFNKQKSREKQSGFEPAAFSPKGFYSEETSLLCDEARIFEVNDQVKFTDESNLSIANEASKRPDEKADQNNKKQSSDGDILSFSKASEEKESSIVDQNNQVKKIFSNEFVESCETVDIDLQNNLIENKQPQTTETNVFKTFASQERNCETILEDKSFLIDNGNDKSYSADMSEQIFDIGASHKEKNSSSENIEAFSLAYNNQKNDVSLPESNETENISKAENDVKPTFYKSIESNCCTETMNDLIVTGKNQDIQEFTDETNCIHPVSYQPENLDDANPFETFKQQEIASAQSPDIYHRIRSTRSEHDYAGDMQVDDDACTLGEQASFDSLCEDKPKQTQPETTNSCSVTQYPTVSPKETPNEIDQSNCQTLLHSEVRESSLERFRVSENTLVAVLQSKANENISDCEDDFEAHEKDNNMLPSSDPDLRAKDNVPLMIKASYQSQLDERSEFDFPNKFVDPSDVAQDDQCAVIDNQANFDLNEICSTQSSQNETKQEITEHELFGDVDLHCKRLDNTQGKPAEQYNERCTTDVVAASENKLSLMDEEKFAFDFRNLTLDDPKYSKEFVLFDSEHKPKQEILKQELFENIYSQRENVGVQQQDANENDFTDLVSTPHQEKYLLLNKKMIDDSNDKSSLLSKEINHSKHMTSKTDLFVPLEKDLHKALEGDFKTSETVVSNAIAQFEKTTQSFDLVCHDSDRNCSDYSSSSVVISPLSDREFCHDHEIKSVSMMISKSKEDLNSAQASLIETKVRLLTEKIVHDAILNVAQCSFTSNQSVEEESLFLKNDVEFVSTGEKLHLVDSMENTAKTTVCKVTVDTQDTAEPIIKSNSSGIASESNTNRGDVDKIDSNQTYSSASFLITEEATATPADDESCEIMGQKKSTSANFEDDSEQNVCVVSPELGSKRKCDERQPTEPVLNSNDHVYSTRSELDLNRSHNNDEAKKDVCEKSIDGCLSSCVESTSNNYSDYRKEQKNEFDFDFEKQHHTTMPEFSGNSLAEEFATVGEQSVFVQPSYGSRVNQRSIHIQYSEVASQSSTTSSSSEETFSQVEMETNRDSLDPLPQYQVDQTLINQKNSIKEEQDNSKNNFELAITEKAKTVLDEVWERAVLASGTAIRQLSDIHEETDSPSLFGNISLQTSLQETDQISNETSETFDDIRITSQNSEETELPPHETIVNITSNDGRVEVARVITKDEEHCVINEEVAAVSEPQTAEEMKLNVYSDLTYSPPNKTELLDESNTSKAVDSAKFKPVEINDKLRVGVSLKSFVTSQSEIIPESQPSSSVEEIFAEEIGKEIFEIQSTNRSNFDSEFTALEQDRTFLPNCTVHDVKEAPSAFSEKSFSQEVASSELSSVPISCINQQSQITWSLTTSSPKNETNSDNFYIQSHVIIAHDINNDFYLGSALSDLSPRPLSPIPPSNDKQENVTFLDETATYSYEKSDCKDTAVSNHTSLSTPTTGDSVGEVSATNGFSFREFPQTQHSNFSTNSAGTTLQFSSDEVFTSEELYASTKVNITPPIDAYHMATDFSVAPSNKPLLTLTSDTKINYLSLDEKSPRVDDSVFELEAVLPETASSKPTSDNQTELSLELNASDTKDESEYTSTSPDTVMEQYVVVGNMTENNMDVDEAAGDGKKSKSLETQNEQRQSFTIDDVAFEQNFCHVNADKSSKNINRNESSPRAKTKPKPTLSSQNQKALLSADQQHKTCLNKTNEFYFEDLENSTSEDERSSACSSLYGKRSSKSRSSRIPVGRSTMIKQSVSKAAKSESRKFKSVDFSLTQSLPTRSRKNKLTKDSLKFHDIILPLSDTALPVQGMTRPSSTSKLPVRRSSFPKVKKRLKKHRRSDLVSPSSTVSHSSSGSNFSYKFRKSDGSSPVQEGAFRGESFTNKVLKSEKYIALREGVFTYKTSPAFEREERSKKECEKTVKPNSKTSQSLQISNRSTQQTTETVTQPSSRNTNFNGNQLSSENPFLGPGPRLDSACHISSGSVVTVTSSDNKANLPSTAFNKKEISSCAGSSPSSNGTSLVTLHQFFDSRSSKTAEDNSGVEDNTSINLISQKTDREQCRSLTDEDSSGVSARISETRQCPLAGDLNFLLDRFNIDAHTFLPANIRSPSTDSSSMNPCVSPEQDLPSNAVSLNLEDHALKTVPYTFPVDNENIRDFFRFAPHERTDQLSETLMSRKAHSSAAQTSHVDESTTLSEVDVTQASAELIKHTQKDAFLPAQYVREDSLDLESFSRLSSSLSSESMEYSCSSVLREVEAEAARAISITPDSIESPMGADPTTWPRNENQGNSYLLDATIGDSQERLYSDYPHRFVCDEDKHSKFHLDESVSSHTTQPKMITTDHHFLPAAEPVETLSVSVTPSPAVPFATDTETCSTVHESSKQSQLKVESDLHFYIHLVRVSLMSCICAISPTTFVCPAWSVCNLLILLPAFSIVVTLLLDCLQQNFFDT